MNKCSKKYFNNRLIKVLLIILLLTAYSLPLNATIRYVSKTGLSIPPYTTWETAADSIQKCINISEFGDTIYVANGVYEEQVMMIPGLSLIGAGADSCEINTINLVSSQNFTSVSIAGNCLIKGFLIIVNNNTEEGIGIGGVGSVINSVITENRITTAYEGIYLGGNPTIYKNNFDNISIGIELFNSNASVQNNVIYTDPNSQLTIIAGIYMQAFDNNYTPTIDSNYIEANTRGEGIRKSFGARPTIRNNIIILKNAPAGMYLSTTDSLYVYNNLIIAEAGALGIYNSGVQYLRLYNNYITGNLGDAITIGAYDLAKNNVVTNVNKGIIGNVNSIIQYNDIWNNNINYTGLTPDSTNLSVNPMVVNDDTTQGKLDFHLQMFSPLIDAGDPSILDKDSTRSDIGLYGGSYGESYIYVDLPPRPPVNLTVVVDTLIKIKWNRNTEADFNHYNLYRDTTSNFTVDSTKLVLSLTDTFYNHIIPVGVESLYFKLTGVDNQNNESNPSEEVGVLITSVKDEWKPLNNYILYQNYPNPFNPTTKIGYKLKERGYVKLYVYDIKGELVSVLVNEVQEVGYYEVLFDASVSHSGDVWNLASGVYIYQIFVSNDSRIPIFSDVKKMMYLK